MPLLLRYLGTHVAFSFGVTLLLNWAIVWYDSDLLTLGNYGVNNDNVPSLPAADDAPLKANCHLVVGVLSAREHVEQRRGVRSAWWRSGSSDVTRCRWFVVGNESCPIHPLDRTDIYGCHLWEVKELEARSGLRLSSSVVQSGQWSATESKKIYSAFSFNVHHPIVVSKLGVLTTTTDETSDPKTIVLVNAVSKEIVAKVTIGGDLQSGVVVDGYAYRAIEPVLLPTGFEGSVLVETDEELDDSDIRIDYDTAGGVITFQHVSRNDGDFEVFHDRIIVSTSFGYEVHDVEGLKRKLVERPQRQIEWSRKVALDSKRLQEEMEEHRDIIVVDVLDVYRNLIKKLLRFYEWISKNCNSELVIKSDDDTFLNLERIENYLKSSNGTKKWWGQFRHNWAVQRHGKWRELSYKSVSYPPFACGTAYALSSDLISWLASNQNFLQTYQGEDVSMGIWMAAVGATMVHDTRWQCSDECIDDAFSRGQLEPPQMINTLTSLKQCGHICNCTSF